MTRFAYFNGEIRPIEEANISIMNLSFNYGIGCFGGLRGYWSESQQQLNVFRIRDHYQRFLNSAKMLMAEFDYTIDKMVDITVELLSREGWQENCYIRPLAYKGNTTSGGVQLHGLDDQVAIFSTPAGKILKVRDGLHVGTSSWRRVDDGAMPARGKLTGAYVNSAFARSEAMLNGFDEALVLNPDGHVAEASVANFMMIRDNVVITPPVSSNVLEGITRRTLLHLISEELGLKVVEREVDRTELYIADEAFFCGTGMQIAPILSVDRRTTGDGQMGPITRQIHDLYFRIVFAEEARYHHWLTPIPILELA